MGSCKPTITVGEREYITKPMPLPKVSMHVMTTLGFSMPLPKVSMHVMTTSLVNTLCGHLSQIFDCSPQGLQQIKTFANIDYVYRDDW